MRICGGGDSEKEVLGGGEEGEEGDEEEKEEPLAFRDKFSSAGLPPSLAGDSRRSLAARSDDSDERSRGDWLVVVLFPSEAWGSPERPGDDSGNGPNGG